MRFVRPNVPTTVAHIGSSSSARASSRDSSAARTPSMSMALRMTLTLPGGMECSIRSRRTASDRATKSQRRVKKACKQLTAHSIKLFKSMKYTDAAQTRHEEADYSHEQPRFKTVSNHQINFLP